jgi:predicted N-formylglutamate amidohydrolase
MREECLDCNRSLDDCTCIEDTIELPNQALIDAAERYIAGDNYNRYYDDFIEGAKWSQQQNDTSKVKRVEVIQHSPPYNGRAFTKYNAKDVEIQFQDDGRTLKIFLK